MERNFGKLIVKVTDEPEEEFVLTQTITTIGSAETNDIPIKRAKLSRAHARIECTEAGCTLFDLESSQGTIVNNQAVQQVNLATGDVIRMGEAELRFESSAAPDSSDATILDAAILADEPPQQASETEPASPQKEMDALYTVQAGKGQTPFFCVVGRYSDVGILKTLADHMKSEQPIYALQPPKPADGPPLLTNLDALVAHYIDQITG